MTESDIKINETINVCSPQRARNIFVRFYLPFALKSIKPEFKCPLFGEYQWITDTKQNIGDNFGFVPPMMRKFPKILLNLKSVLFTRINGKRVIMLTKDENLKATVR
jgi:hypothetical protein